MLEARSSQAECSRCSAAARCRGRQRVIPLNLCSGRGVLEGSSGVAEKAFVLGSGSRIQGSSSSSSSQQTRSEARGSRATAAAAATQQPCRRSCQQKGQCYGIGKHTPHTEHTTRPTKQTAAAHSTKDVFDPQGEDLGHGVAISSSV